MAAANMRPRISVAPPGAKGTRSLIVRSGKPCASAMAGAANSSASSQKPGSKRERGMGMAGFSNQTDATKKSGKVLLQYRYSA